MEMIVKSPNEMIELGKKIGSKLKANDVLLLAGDLGAGKTTLTKGIGFSLGVKRNINSPTFTLVKEYQGDNLRLYHIDLYRLDSLGSDFDLEEYFDAGGVAVCEWPLNVCEILPNEYIKIEIFYTDTQDERKVVISYVGDKYQNLLEDISC